MGTYILQAHPDLGQTDTGEVNALINEFMGGDDKKANERAKAYLKKNGADEVVYVTNDENLMSAANKVTLGKGQVTISTPANPKPHRVIGHNGLTQAAQFDPNTKEMIPKTIYINPESPNHKPMLNILIHEIGHLQWPGIGIGENHDPLFYRLLSDTLKSFNITPDPDKDLSNIHKRYSECQVNSIPLAGPLTVPAIDYRRKTGDPNPSPTRDYYCKLLTAAPAPGKKTGQNEGLRYLHTPKVVSINPSVNLTPMGGAVVPVPYTVVGYFDESVNTTKSVRFTSDQVFTMTSFVREVHGDAPGSAGGIKSGTVSATAEPIEHSVNVRAERFHIVRHDDLFYMNNRNTIGRAIFIVSSGDQGNTA